MRVGVTGTGTMDGGITQAFVQVDGHEVYLCDLIDAFTKGGKERIEKGLAGRVAEGKLSQEEMDKTLGYTHADTKDICKGCDLVIEVTTENMQIKKRTFEELSEIRKKDCLFATNASSLSTTEIGAGLDYPVTGMHFFNPTLVMKLIEVISSLNTPREDLDHITKIAGDIGKAVVPMQEFAGFVANRILIPMINEVISVYAGSNVPAEKIDEAMKLDANHPAGSPILGNPIGLDVVLAIMEVLQSEIGDTKYRPHSGLHKMVRNDKLGKKIGRGFYDCTK